MPAEQERIERARLDARSAARDLIRLVRALDLRGVDLDHLDGPCREALEACNYDLANALSAVERVAETAALSLEAMESRIAATRARLAATRTLILSGLERSRRIQVLEAMLSVHVADEDLEVESVASPVDLAAARARAEQRLARRRKAEVRRRRAEAIAIAVDAPIAELLAGLPRPWLAAIAGHAGLERDAPSPAIAAALLADDGRLVHELVAELRPDDREALAALLAADGVVLARVLEARWGDATEDGWAWDEEPPTSVVGRLRVRGLCVVGRAAIGPNPRSRPRVAIVPIDLRGIVTDALAATAPPSIEDPVIDAELIEQVLEGRDEAEDEAEADGVAFDRAQPDLAGFAVSVGEELSEQVGMGALVYYVARVWAVFEVAFPGRVPRLRRAQIEAARRQSTHDIDAVAVMHERLLERRVATMVAAQPHLYASLAATLDDMPWSEEDKLLVFHACDTALRAFHTALLR